MCRSTTPIRSPVIDHNDLFAGRTAVRRAARAESFNRVVQDETLRGYPISHIAIRSEQALKPNGFFPNSL